MTDANLSKRTPPAKPFWLLWSCQALSLLGSQAVQFALIWWLTAETGSAATLATAAVVGLLPQVLLGPLIGTFVDRWDRKYIMLVADGAVALVSAWLAYLYFTDAIGVSHLMVALGLRAIGASFHSAAMTSSTTLMVPASLLSRIQGLNQALQGGAPLLSAPLGALLVAALPMSSILLVDVITALVAITPLVFIRVPQPATSQSTDSSFLGDMALGFRYLGKHRGQLYLLCGAAGVNLVAVPAFVLLPLFVISELQGTALQLGWLEMIFGAGSIAGGVLLGIWGGFERRIVTALFGLAAMGIAVISLGLAPAEIFSAALVSMLLVGTGTSLVNGSIHAILQATVPPDYQGRIFTLVASVAGAMTPLGLALAAPVAEVMGVRFWYLAGGVTCLVAAGAATMVRAIMEIETTATLPEDPARISVESPGPG
ncbi:MFS transporter [Microbulbifer sp. YPW16]|uniref:MFS transporter n=1 Tax=Microbulbifer sp. YPW16 TaxID=2904242 RepID=UPI0021032B70|nr:MFS transporter [Microbulbifer sp. YPW16]